MRLTFDALTNRLLPGSESLGGTYGVISFVRLRNVLHRAGEIRIDEKITHFTIDTERGTVEYRTEFR